MTEQERIEYLEAELRKLKQQTKTTTTYERQTTYKSEPSLLDKVVDGAAFGAGFSVVNNLIDNLFE